MFNKNFYFQTTYLINYDLINKYNIKDLYNKPDLNSITLNFPLHTFSSLLYKDKVKSNSTNNNNIKKILYFISYFFSPHLFYIKVKKRIEKKKVTHTNCYLQLKIKGQKNIHYFLISLLIENLFIIKKFQKNFFNKTNFSKITSPKLKSNFFLTKTISASLFLDLNNTILSLCPNFNVKDLLVNFCFKFVKQNNIVLQEQQSFIKNLFLFWL